MAVKLTGRCKLAQLVANHVLGNVYGHMLAAVMNGESVTNELGKMVEERLQVFTTLFLPASFRASTFLYREGQNVRPFLVLLDIVQKPP